MFGTDSYGTVIALAILALPVGVATTFFLEVMRLRQQPTRYVLVSWFGAGVSVALILYLVAVEDRGLEGFYLAGVLGAIPTLLVAYVVARGAIALAVQWRALRTMLTFALPLIPVAATAWVLQFADRLFVLHFADLHDLGIYALGVRLSNVLLLGISAFAFAWTPFILELFSRDREQERQIRVRALTNVAFAAALGAVCVSVYAREFFVTITDPSFADAYKLVGVLSAGLYALALNVVTMTGITIARRTRFFAQYAVYAAVLNIALNFLLIPSLGIMGAAVATSVTYLALSVLYYRRAQALEPVPFDGRRVLEFATLAGVVIVVGTFVIIDPLWVSVLVKIPIVLAFPLVAWALGWLDPGAARLLHLPPAGLRRA